MEAPLHTECGDARECPCDEVPLVANCCRVWEVGDLRIGNDGRILEHIAQLTQTATEDDRGLDILGQA